MNRSTIRKKPWLALTLLAGLTLPGAAFAAEGAKIPSPFTLPLGDPDVATPLQADGALWPKDGAREYRRVEDRGIIAKAWEDDEVDYRIVYGNHDIYYRGAVDTGEDCEIILDPSSTFEEGDALSLTLSAGHTWASDWPCEANTPYLKGDRTNNDRTLRLVFTEDVKKAVRIGKWQIRTAPDAATGPLMVELKGIVSGRERIGQTAAPFAVAVEKKTIVSGDKDAAIGTITLTEYAAGALKRTDGIPRDDAQPGYLDMALPQGAAFAKTPKVSVTQGDLALRVVGLTDDRRKLRLQITRPSTSASVIRLSNVVLSLDSRFPSGNLTARFGTEYNVIDSQELAATPIASVSPLQANWRSIFTIGQKKFHFKGNKHDLDAPPYIKNSRAYLPLRFAAWAVGARDQDIFWNDKDQTIVILLGNRSVSMRIGSKTLIINGKAIPMDTAPEIRSGRTFLPIRWLAEALDADLSWDEDTQSVVIEPR